MESRWAKFKTGEVGLSSARIISQKAALSCEYKSLQVLSIKFFQPAPRLELSNKRVTARRVFLGSVPSGSDGTISHSNEALRTDVLYKAELRIGSEITNSLSSVSRCLTLVPQGGMGSGTEDT